MPRASSALLEVGMLAAPTVFLGVTIASLRRIFSSIRCWQSCLPTLAKYARVGHPQREFSEQTEEG